MSCGLLVMMAGCLPDPTGSHGKSVYALGSHRFASADLYNEVHQSAAAAPEKGTPSRKGYTLAFRMDPRNSENHQTRSSGRVGYL